MIFTNPSQSRESVLIVEWGKQSLSFSVFHEQDNRVLHTEIIDLEKELYDCTSQDFEKIFKEQEIFAFSFDKTICLIDTSFSTLVPSVMFDESKKEELLRFVHDLPSGNFTFQHESILSSEYELVYAIPQILKDSIQKHFVNPHFSITQVSLLNYFTKFTQLDEFFITFFNGFEVSIVYYKNNHLEFFNTFTYLSAEDVVYNVLNVINELELNNERVVIHYCGLLPEESDKLDLLKQYVKFIKPLERSNKMNYSPKVEQMPSHYFIQHYASIL